MILLLVLGSKNYFRREQRRGGSSLETVELQPYKFSKVCYFLLCENLNTLLAKTKIIFTNHSTCVNFGNIVWPA